jgi:hypothetical protein
MTSHFDGCGTAFAAVLEPSRSRPPAEALDRRQRPRARLAKAMASGIMVAYS